MLDFQPNTQANKTTKKIKTTCPAGCQDGFISACHLGILVKQALGNGLIAFNAPVTQERPVGAVIV
jgi:hypothetical protein